VNFFRSLSPLAWIPFAIIPADIRPARIDEGPASR
jgi:hypothetical protein